MERRVGSKAHGSGSGDDALPLLASGSDSSAHPSNSCSSSSEGCSSSSSSSNGGGGGARHTIDASPFAAASQGGKSGFHTTPPSRLKNVSGFDLPAAPSNPAAPAAAGSGGGGGGAQGAAGSSAKLTSMFWDNGLATALTAYAVFAISSFCVKLTHGHVPVLELCLVRSALSFALSVALMRGMGVSPMFGHRKNWPLLAARGICGAISMMLYYVSIQLLPLGDAVTIGLIQPPITAVAARLVLKEPLGLRGGLGCIVSVAGVVFICQPPFLFGDKTGASAADTRLRLIGSAAGMAAALISASNFLIIRKLGSAEKATVVAMAFHTATLAMSLGPLLAGWPQRAVLPSMHNCVLLIGVAVTSFFGQLLMTRALQCTAAAKVSATSFTSVIYSYALSAVFFHQGITPVSAAGVACTLCGVVLVVLRHGPKPPKAAPPGAAPACGGASLLAAAPQGGAEGLAERMLKKKASGRAGAGASAAGKPPMPLPQQPAGGGAARGSEGGPECGGADRAYSRQGSLFQRISMDLRSQGGAAAAAAAVAAKPLVTARKLIRNLSAAAVAQMVQQPSASAAELALASDGACSACTAAVAASAAALEAYGPDGRGGPGAAAPSGGGGGEEQARQESAAAAAAAAAAAEAVAALFRGDEQQGHGRSSGGGGGLIPAGQAGVRSDGALGRGHGHGHDSSDDECDRLLLARLDASGGAERGGESAAAAAPPPPPRAAPRMSSRLSEGLDPCPSGGGGGGIEGDQGSKE